jgi:hypothetical protein
MKGLFVKGTCLMCLLGLIFICGCATRLADLTIASTRNVALDEVDLDSLPQTQGVVGEDSSFVFLFIPFGFPHLEDAIDDALDKAGGDVMLDAIIYSKSWWFLVGQNKLEVKGTVVKTRGTK